jgi:hypothetical protein
MCPDIFSEASKEDRVEHKPLHSVDTLQHDLVALSLGSAMQVADVGDGVLGFHKVGIAKGVGDVVVKLLDWLIWFLTQILEANTKRFAVYFGA